MMTGLECLAMAIFFEARDQPVDGQKHVAEVIMNRVEDTRFPDTICDVVWQKKQFSFTHDGLSDNIDKHHTEKTSAKVARLIAKEVIEHGHTHTTSTHYHNTKVSPFWIDQKTRDGQIGDHIFYTWE